MSADRTSAARPTPKAPRRAITGLIVLTTAITVVDGFDLVVFATALPVLIRDQEWGMTAVSGGNVASLQMLGLLVGAILSGYLGDRIGRRRTIIGNLVVFSVFTGLVAVAPNLATVGVLRFLGGLGLGGIVPVLIALIAEYSPENRRYLNNTIMLAGSGVGAFLAPLSGALLLPRVDFRWLFVAGGLLGVVLIPFTIRFLPESIHFLQGRQRTEEARRLSARYGLAAPADASAAVPKVRIRSLFTGEFLLRTVLILIAEFFVFGITFGLLTTWLPQYLVLSGFTISSALQLGALAGVAAVIGSLVGGMLQDRVGARSVVIGYSLLGSAALLVLGFVLQAHPLVAVFVFVLGFAHMLYLMNGFVANCYPAEARSTMVGLAFGVGRVGSVVATAAGGWLAAARFAPEWNFWAWIVPMLVPAIVLAFVRTRRPVGVEVPRGVGLEVVIR